MHQELGLIWLRLVDLSLDGYKALGFVVMSTQDKPSVEEVRCVWENVIKLAKSITSFGV